MKPYITILQEACVETEVKGSKFLAHLMPVDTEDEATAFVEKIKKKHYNATHNVPVYLIGADMKVQRYSDDGEPSGTAGVPILEMLKKEEITNICVVVTRYFGGVKLGTGGLVRAYTDAVKAAFDDAQIVKRALYQKASFVYDYSLHGKIENIIQNTDSVLIEAIDYLDQVKMTVIIEPQSVEAFQSILTEVSAGTLELSIENLCYKTIQIKR